jgi:CMP-N-acetylneuraminic acid synthetase
MYFCSVEAFLKTASFFSDPLIGYQMPPEDSLDLDWPHQFEMAEVLLKQRNP